MIAVIVDIFAHVNFCTFTLHRLFRAIKLIITLFFFFRFFFRFLSRRSWSSTHVLFLDHWGTFCAGGLPNVHFSWCHSGDSNPCISVFILFSCYNIFFHSCHICAPTALRERCENYVPCEHFFVHSIYGSSGSRNVRAFEHRVAVFTAHSDWQCWPCYSIGVYGSKTVFSLPFFKYCSNVQTVSEKMFCLCPNVPIMTLIVS